LVDFAKETETLYIQMFGFWADTKAELVKKEQELTRTQEQLALAVAHGGKADFCNAGLFVDLECCREELALAQRQIAFLSTHLRGASIITDSLYVRLRAMEVPDKLYRSHCMVLTEARLIEFYLQQLAVVLELQS